MWRYLIILLLAMPIVYADEVLLFAGRESVLITGAQLIVNDKSLVVSAVNPANDTIIDRDSFDPTDFDVIALVVSVPSEFPDGTSIAFVANITLPAIGGQSNVVLGYNTSTSGTATLYYNPNTTSYAGNWTWFAQLDNSITSGLRNVIVKGSATTVFASASINPNASYVRADTVLTVVNLTSNGPESLAELNASYNAVVNSQFTNRTGSNSLAGLTFTGSNWQSNFAISTLGGVGLWNASLLSALDFFYTPTSNYREFFVFGRMNVTAITANPDSIAATDFTTISCAVQDQESSYAVTGANVSFYRNNTFLGWNLTNATGNSTLTFSINSSGLWNITCIIQNQSNIQYSVGGAPNASTMVNVTNLGPVFIAGINDASDTTNTTNMGELVTFMTGANDPELDEWYLLICGSAGVTAGSCNGFEYCRSGYTSSGANANCSVNTTGYTNRTYPWFAYPCDNTSSCGVSNSATSPFVINHVPIAYPHITPASPTAAQNLTCVINATDPDPGDTVSGNYSWWLRDESAGPFDPIIGQTGSVLPNSQYDSNDQVLCSALPIDQHNFAGTIVNSSSVTIAQGALSASATLSAPNMTVLYSVVLSVSCTVATGDSEDVTLTIEDDRTGGFAQSSASPADVSVNTSSISLGTLSGTSATHQVRITGETTGTYQFRARCTTTDTTPVTATSTAQTVTVLADLSAPIISLLDTTPTNQSVQFDWSTDDPSDSLVEYGLTPALGLSVFNPTLVNVHSINITGLLEKTDYFYNITSCNTDGFCSTVGLFSVRTLGSEVGFPYEGGYFTGTFVERGPEANVAINGSITKGDVFEIFLETPQGLDSQDEVTVIITVKGKEIRKRITLPYTIKSPETPIYP